MVVKLLRHQAPFAMKTKRSVTSFETSEASFLLKGLGHIWCRGVWECEKKLSKNPYCNRTGELEEEEEEEEKRFWNP